ncbi:MAG TPA: phage tail tube protein [Fervidobacterium sp.]|nr:phage tail tube protein [Fervidobacterium sp.]HUM44759.1 phage tail tube protein [Fervidobacterium sp.]
MAIIGVGTTLKIGGTLIGKVTNIGGPSMSKETVDTTSFDNTDGYRSFIAGLKDAGTLTFTLMFDKTVYSTLKAAFEDNTAKAIEITLPDATKLTFNGFVTELPLTVPTEDKVTCDVTVKISGAVTLA